MGYWIRCLVPALLLLLLSAEVRVMESCPVLSLPTDYSESYGSDEILTPYDEADKALTYLLTLRMSLFSQLAEVASVTHSSDTKWLYRAVGACSSLGNQRIHLTSSCFSSYRKSVFLGRGSGHYLYRLGHLLI